MLCVKSFLSVQALSVSDLNMVLFLCERVDAQRLFSTTPCVLPQPVLLSLIQQLSADLGTATELKLKYAINFIYKFDILRIASYRFLCFAQLLAGSRLRCWFERSCHQGTRSYGHVPAGTPVANAGVCVRLRGFIQSDPIVALGGAALAKSLKKLMKWPTPSASVEHGFWFSCAHC